MLWYWSAGPLAHRFERLMPDGSAELVINLAEDRLVNYDRDDQAKCEVIPGAVVAGPHSQYFVIDTARQELMGVHFKPGGAFPFLGVPLNEAHNREVALECFWGGWSRKLRERLLEAPGLDRRFQVLEETLRGVAARRMERHAGVAWAIGQLRGQATVAEVTEKIGMSPKRFIAAFRQEVGLTPKVYSRVQRFQRAMRRARHGRTVDWAGLAIDCGYYDQAHFAHEFREFSGMSPGEYRKAGGHEPNHVPLL